MIEEIRLEPVEREDLDFMLKLWKNPDIMHFWFREPYMNKEKLESMFKKFQEDDTIRQFTVYADDERIGYTSLFEINLRHRNAAFAIMLNPDHHGKGHAEKIVHQVADYGFYQLNLNKINLDVVDYHKKAIHIYEKVGFKIEGKKEQQYLIRGNFENSYSMGLLKENYQKKEK